MSTSLQLAARAIHDAQYLLFTAGAGMGVDSGLPDFRGTEGFWRAYPPFQRLGLQFQEVANPRWFISDPQLAWGFYGHRYNLYRATTPHAGFAILKRWADAKDARVFTSNVDGHFQRSGFSEEQVCEVHGSLLHLQCVRPCSNAIWDAGNLKIDIDETTFRTRGELPKCPNCGGLARPNVLMFGDSKWRSERSDEQLNALDAWAGNIPPRQLAVIEMGAGNAVPTVRHFSESMKSQGATLIRINVRESFGPAGTISIDLGAKEALQSIDELLNTG
ncbi:NAD-dependent protein deacetylase [bacterium]|nr:MAG: NAD-dependent protein deacetylase [bacterium]